MLFPSHGIPRPHFSLSKRYPSRVTKTSSLFAGESHFVPLTICKDKPQKYLNIKMIPGENLTAYLSNLKLGKAIHKGTMRYHITPMNLTKF